MRHFTHDDEDKKEEARKKKIEDLFIPMADPPLIRYIRRDYVSQPTGYYSTTATYNYYRTNDTSNPWRT